MKTVSGPTSANITDHNNLVSCFFVKQRVGGRIQGFTEHDKKIPFDLGDGNGTITYKAANSFNRTAVSNTDTFAVDNLEVQGILDPDAFPQDDIDAGKYDRAEIKQFLVDWTDLTLDPIKIRRGFVGEIITAEKGFQAQLRGMLQRYTEEIVEVYTPLCRVDLGDPRCGVRLEPPIWLAATAYTVRPIRDAALGAVVRPSAFNDRHFKCIVAGTSGLSEPAWDTTIGNPTVESVSGGPTWEAIQALTIEVVVESVTNRGKFIVTYSGDAPDALLKGGLAKFTSGENTTANGISPVEVKKWDLSIREVTLYLPMPLSVAGGTDTVLLLEDGTGHLLFENGTDKLLMESGDTLKIQAGCDKTLPACRDTYDNIFNAQAEFYIPGIKVLVRTPDAQ